MPSRKNSMVVFNHLICTPAIVEAVPPGMREGFVRMSKWHIAEAARENGCAAGVHLPETDWCYSWTWCDWLIIMGPATNRFTGQLVITLDIAELREIERTPDGVPTMAAVGISKFYGET